jgi:hypothetical protein
VLSFPPLAETTQNTGMSNTRLGSLLVVVPLLGLVFSFSPRRASAATEHETCLEACLARCDEEEQQRKSGCINITMVEDSCRPSCEYDEC